MHGILLVALVAVVIPVPSPASPSSVPLTAVPTPTPTPTPMPDEAGTCVVGAAVRGSTDGQARGDPAATSRDISMPSTAAGGWRRGRKNGEAFVEVYENVLTNGTLLKLKQSTLRDSVRAAGFTRCPTAPGRSQAAHRRPTTRSSSIGKKQRR